MAIVLTNGIYYIKMSKTGGIQKTSKLEEAQTFYSCNTAMRKVFKAPGLCKGYYPYDTDDTTSARRKRIQYSTEERRTVYNKADGRCQICGRKIPFEELSIDHVIPLSLGGEDAIDNLQSTDCVCNKLKNNIPQEIFLDRITDIFMYQMEKKYCNNLRWKVIYRALRKMV